MPASGVIAFPLLGHRGRTEPFTGSTKEVYLKASAFPKKEPVLFVSAVLAALSMFIVHPDTVYIGYINWSVLATLFCLMAVTAGLRQTGLFEFLSDRFIKSGLSGRFLALVLIAVCFFASALITNDVVLITFVPFTISLFGHGRNLIRIIVMETVAANLGSLTTPVGNPQNLFLYSYYSLDFGRFLSVTLPLGGVCLILVAVCSLLLVRGSDKIESSASAKIRPPVFPLCRYCALFLLCILVVLKVLDWKICLGVSVLCLFLFDRPLFSRVDYSLIVSFFCFFIFVGNLARIGPVDILIHEVLMGHVLLVSALASQCISNVPAAALLASFTDDWKSLLLGVNIGGLGTLIASMASLISYRFYSVSENAERGRYLAVFSAVNFSLLALLLLLSFLLL